MRKAGVRTATVRAGTALLLLGVSGCSSVPDQVNPAEWYRSASSWLSSDPAPNAAQTGPSAIEAPLPAERADTFPNIASVPDRPTPTVDPATRRDMVASMRRESDAAQAEAAALDRRAEAEVARREQPMVTPQPEPAAPVERPMASLALPPDATALPRPAAAPAPAPAPAQPEASQSVPSGATVPLQQPMPAPVTAQPAFQEPQAAPPSAPRTAGFTPGAPLAPRPPVLPPQPLSQRAAG